MATAWWLGVALTPEDIRDLLPRDISVIEKGIGSETYDDGRMVVICLGGNVAYGRAYYSAIATVVESDDFTPPGWMVQLSKRLQELDIANSIATPIPDDERVRPEDGDHKIWHEKLGELPKRERHIGELLERRGEAVLNVRGVNEEKIKRLRSAGRRASRHLGFKKVHTYVLTDGSTLVISVPEPRTPYEAHRRSVANARTRERIFNTDAAAD